MGLKVAADKKKTVPQRRENHKIIEIKGEIRDHQTPFALKPNASLFWKMAEIFKRKPTGI